MTAKGRPGEFRNQIPADTNDVNHRTVELMYHGRALEVMTIEPPIINLGSITSDATSKSGAVILKRADGGPLAPEVIPPRNPNISAEVHELAPGEKYELSVTLNAPWPGPRIFELLTVKTGVPEIPTKTVSVSATIEPRLKARLPRFTIPPNVQTETTLENPLIWSGGPPGNVLGVKVTDPALKVELVERDEWPTLLLTVPPAYAPAERTPVSVVVTTDDPAAPELTVPVLLQVARAPTTRPVGGRPRAYGPQPLTSAPAEGDPLPRVTTQPAGQPRIIIPAQRPAATTQPRP